jgi:hypothetical protein
MTQHWIKERAASVRGTWSANERRVRAEAGKQRFGELLAQLGLWPEVRQLRLAPAAQSRSRSHG